MATLLRGAGYHTAAIGKMHFNTATSSTASMFASIGCNMRARYLKEHPPKPLPPDIEVLPPPEHLKRTARQPELVPKDRDVHAVLEFCLQPRDGKAPDKSTPRP